MPWVKFVSDFDWKPKQSVTVAFKAGASYLVTRACADKAVSTKKAIRVKSPE